ncbi:MAG TPA: dethiobiotin synthase [Chthoniobacteraceae bacterium]|jgi:dethiobiotin synthetase
MSFFVTGTDTNAGKTYVASLLIRSLRKRGIDCVGMKPICSGGREDAEELRQAGDDAAELNHVNPVWLRAPAAPYTAAMIENRMIDLDLVRESFAVLRAKHASVVVEGVGGWLVPILRDYFVADLAAEMALPVVVVVPNRLGALNHTMLTVRAIQSAGLRCAGVILNQLSPENDADTAMVTNRGVLETLLGEPLLLEVPHGTREIELGADTLQKLGESV